MKKYLQQLINSSNQWILTGRNNQVTLTNSYTSQQYIPYYFTNALKPEKQIKQFFERQSNHLPHTPKIKIFNHLNHQQEITLLLVQNAPFSFQNLVEFYKNEPNNLGLLNLVFKATCILEMLYKKYGLFQCNQRFFKVGKGPSLLIWMNQDFSKNYPQYSLNYLIQQGKDIKFLLKTMLKSFLQVLTLKISKLSIIKELLFEKQYQTFECIKRRIMDQIKNIQGKLQVNQRYRRHSQVLQQVPNFILKRSLTKLSLRLTEDNNKNMTKIKQTVSLKNLDQKYDNAHPIRCSFASTQDSINFSRKKLDYQPQEQLESKKIKQQLEAFIQSTFGQEIIEEQNWEDQLEIELQKILNQKLKLN